MGITATLLFLVEASTAACGPVSPAELTGRPEVVDAVLDFEEEAPKLAEPTLAARQSSAASPADTGSNPTEHGRGPVPCQPAPMPIA